MTPDYNDGYLSDARDPVDSRSQDFAWDEVLAALGEKGTSRDPELAEALLRTLTLLVGNTRRLSPQGIGLRLIALLWTLNPALFADEPSLRALAERTGVKPSTLAFYTGNASRTLRYRNRAQRHAANWRERKAA